MTETGVLRGLRILLVDDDQDCLDALSALLAMNGADVRCVPDGAKAIDVLQAFRPDLVISDLSMPVGDGFELIATLRARSPEEGGLTPAIAVSGMEDPLTRARALQCGFQRFIPKPVDAAHLLRTVAVLTFRDPG